jgi:hypothetical protein
MLNWRQYSTKTPAMSDPLASPFFLIKRAARAPRAWAHTLDAAGMRRARQRRHRPAEAHFRADSTKRGNSRPPQAEISAKWEA